MAKKIINIGKSQNKGDGDPLRTAFSKVNDNFDELYSGSFTDTTDFTTSIIPRTDNEISLGSSTKRWSELYVKDFIFINGVRLSGSASGDLVVGGNIVQAKDIVGSIFADDSTLMMDGLTGKHYGPLIGDVTGSVFADNSTLLIDGVAGNIPSANISGTEATNWNAAFAWGNHASAGYQIAGAPHDGDVTGSVFADDSSMLVNGVEGKLVLSNNTTAELPEQGNLYFTDARADARVNSIVTQAFVNTLNVTASSTVGTVTGTLDGDVTGSVFGDDSTLLVDGINNKIVGPVLSSDLRSTSSNVTIGLDAGLTNQGTYSIAIGERAGNLNQSADGIAIGYAAGRDDQQTDGIAIGQNSGQVNQGASSVAIGTMAGKTNQHANTIILSATGATFDSTQANALFVKPIRNAVGTTMLMYDATSGEVTHSGNVTLGGDLDVGGNSIVSASNGAINIAPDGSGTIDLSGQVKFAEGMIEKFATTNGATGVTALDCSTGNVHYLTAPAGDITANFTNLNLTAEYATNVTVVIDQGGTEREITAVQIGGVAQTIVWQGNSAPTGTANGVDSFSFTILNDGGTYVVLGQMVAFGGV